MSRKFLIGMGASMASSSVVWSIFNELLIQNHFVQAVELMFFTVGVAITLYGSLKKEEEGA